MSDVAARLRADARTCIDAALAAVEPGALVRAALDEQRRFTTARAGSVAVLAIGKAADAMTAATLTRLRGAAGFALVVAPAGPAAASPADGSDAMSGASVRRRGGVPVRRLVAPHPVPGPASQNAARMVMAWLDALPLGTRLIVLLSGGASSLLALPAPGLRLPDLTETTAALLASGLPIEAINSVRKQIDLSKGGRLAERVTGRDVLVLAISDVVGDRLDVIGSGPFHPDGSSYRDALAAIDEARLRSVLPGSVVQLIEEGAAGDRPGAPARDAACFRKIAHHVIGNGATARDAACEAATALGYAALCRDEAVTGEARAAGQALVQLALDAAVCAGSGADRGCAIVASGETTVTVRGAGLGGRNQELALAGALAIDGMPGIALASLGTDGVDGPTDAAGAIIDGGSAARMRTHGIDPAAALERNDSYAALDASGDLLRIGATGTNVGDVQIVLRSASAVEIADAE